jgi:hypothetical protein
MFLIEALYLANCFFRKGFFGIIACQTKEDLCTSKQLVFVQFSIVRQSFDILVVENKKMT